MKASAGFRIFLFTLEFFLISIVYSMCVLGKRLLKDIQIDNCTKDIDGTLWQEYCILQNNTNDREFVRNPDMYRSKEKNWMCDSYFQGLFSVTVDYFSKRKEINYFDSFDPLSVSVWSRKSEHLPWQLFLLDFVRAVDWNSIMLSDNFLSLILLCDTK